MIIAGFTISSQGKIYFAVPPSRRALENSKTRGDILLVPEVHRRFKGVSENSNGITRESDGLKKFLDTMLCIKKLQYLHREFSGGWIQRVCFI